MAADNEFAALNEYKDSVEKSKECKYYTAMDLVNKNEYLEAMNIFEELGEYKDSLNKIHEIFLVLTKQYINKELLANEYREVIDKLERVYNLNLTEKDKEAYYLLGYDYFQNKEYDDAGDVLVNIRGFEDAGLLYNESRYQKAIIEANDNNLDNALSIFESLGEDDYRYSTSHAKRIREEILCTFWYGESTRDDGTKFDNVMYFVKIGNSIGGYILSKESITGEIANSMSLSALVAWDGYLMAESGTINFEPCEETIYQSGNEYSITFNDGILNGMEFETKPDDLPEYHISNESIKFTANIEKIKEMKNKYLKNSSIIKPIEELSEFYYSYSKVESAAISDDKNKVNNTKKEENANILFDESRSSKTEKTSNTTSENASSKNNTQNNTANKKNNNTNSYPGTTSKLTSSNNISSKSTTTHTHSYKEATCTKPWTCSCGATIGEALEHSWKSATCTSPQKCENCKITKGVALGHKFDSGNKSQCTRCHIKNPALPKSSDFTVVYKSKSSTYNGCKVKITGHDFLYLEDYLVGEAYFLLSTIVEVEGKEICILVKFYDEKGNYLKSGTPSAYTAFGFSKSDNQDIKCKIPKTAKKIEICDISK